ncbi:LOW QUALITY PROTEIN: proton channel OtopLc-like [Haliotis rubra]|uniref:LOW QUALITY PROTEIN: proton channel OtopLc-like n=1 Tax=Haliotis rubra TaxID=36100 RepID=UPI001EE5AFE7|nr:LOW QUALITY PROTEIN: proton channel OtopLc-like [Haliotis rubra]
MDNSNGTSGEAPDLEAREDMASQEGIDAGDDFSNFERSERVVTSSPDLAKGGGMDGQGELPMPPIVRQGPVAMDTDSDTGTDSDAMMDRGGQGTDDTTSTSESEDTQIWVPVGRQYSSGQSGSESLERYSAKSSTPGENSLDRPCPRRPVPYYATMSNGGTLGGDSRSSGEGGRAPFVNNLQPNLPRRINIMREERQGITVNMASEAPSFSHSLPNGDSGICQDGSEASPTTAEDAFLPDTPPPTPVYKQRRDNALRSSYDHVVQEPLIDSLFVNLSALYAMFVMVLGFVIPISETFTTEPRAYLFQGFYIYLYAVSVLFLLFMYIFVLRTHRCSCRCPCKKRRRRDPLIAALQDKDFKNRFTFSEAAHSHTGSFYLRLGAVGFGIGSMIKSGLQFGDFFESDVMSNCRDIMHGICPIIHLVFTFSQLYFVFLNSKICIQRFKILSRFGVMHLVATNICVWLENIVEETLVELQQYVSEMRMGQGPLIIRNISVRVHSANKSSTIATPQPAFTTTTTPSPGRHCHQESLMKNVVERSGPYLYPCSIEYSLICAGILFVMWRNIGKRGINREQEEQREAKAKAQRLSLDCTGSSRGLFLGILVLVAVVISVITFFVLIGSHERNEAAIMVEHLSEIVIYILTSLAVILAFYKMQGLRFRLEKTLDLEESLILISLLGIYTFSLFSIISAAFISAQAQSLLIIISSVLRMFQATVQTVFIMNALRRYAYVKDHERRKPGREFVTFLLVSNIALWGINTFEVQQSEANPIQIDFFGVLPWNIFTHISSPLAIFYRFHSTVCLSNIWKHAWKRKRA